MCLNYLLEIPEYSALVYDQPLTQVFQGGFPLSCNLRAYVRKFYARKYNGNRVWKAVGERKSWARFNFYVYSEPSRYCLYYIYVRKIYVVT